MSDDFRGTNTGLKLIDLASIMVVAAILGAALLVWQGAPTGPMPMHFNAAGHVDRWGDRNEMALAVGLMGLIAAGAAGYCLMFEHHAKDPVGERFTFQLGRIVSLAAPGLAALLMTLVAFNRLPAGDVDAPFIRVMMGGLAFLFLGLGAFLGRAKPNPVVGVRTYWSLRSRLSWDKSNRLAGRLFSLIGALGLIAAPLAPMPFGFKAMMGAMILAGLASAFESWRVWRIDPART